LKKNSKKINFKLNTKKWNEFCRWISSSFLDNQRITAPTKIGGYVVLSVKRNILFLKKIEVK
jgi:hypothetical protein